MMRQLGRVTIAVLKNLPKAMVWAIVMFIIIALGGAAQEWD